MIIRIMTALSLSSLFNTLQLVFTEFALTKDWMDKMPILVGLVQEMKSLILEVMLMKVDF